MKLVLPGHESVGNGPDAIRGSINHGREEVAERLTVEIRMASASKTDATRFFSL